LSKMPASLSDRIANAGIWQTVAHIISLVIQDRRDNDPTKVSSVFLAPRAQY
jgi:hypothetical protein